MFDHILRQVKDTVLDAVVRPLSGVHPNVVTVLSFLVGVLAAAVIVQQFYVLGFVLWIVSRLLDGLDGAIARVHNKQSDFGGYLDILLDFAMYALIPIALVLAAPSETRYLLLVLLLASFYINAASWMHLAAILEKRNQQTAGRLTSIEMPAGIVAGTETIVFYCLFIVLPQYLEWLFSAMAVLVLLTVMQRLVWAAWHVR
ncbi:MAG: CDP-alcohol phosphatidyltransferase family protein [Chloroflexaceae bacterium]|nr:CDP-alcohol phosphatidyltransferase family protein [Chloroflexaceae bacterium]NJO06266.1 CDP-alcohol phosphatidyltransferase family protein [Chloroflexaceae bacterium]